MTTTIKFNLKQRKEGLPKILFIKNKLKHLSPKEQKQFEAFGQGPVVAPEHILIHQAFEKYALLQPNALAATHLDQSITYGELDQKANQMAMKLIELGVKPGDRVGLFVERSIPMLVGILGILKVGAAYIPQDARITPTVQLRHIIESSDVKVILTLSHLKHRIPLASGQCCVSIDRFLKRSEYSNKAFMSNQLIKAQSSCFILYTSGTTGMPNGVDVTHQNVSNIIMTPPGNLGMKPGLKVSQLLNISFDMAAWEILGALTHGATLIIRDNDIQKAAKQADIIIATPSVLAKLNPSEMTHVKVAAVAGEPCPKTLADTWSSFSTFYNCCGPTETTIVNTMHQHRLGTEKMSIGKPTPNNTVYILDENMLPCKIGEIGEMWAGGECVSAGYIKNDKLSSERYKADPFLGGKRMMFRTRDLGRWNENGELEHFGRTDDQVKINGFRIELDSISTAIESVKSCHQAVTLKLDNKNLVAFVSPKSIDLEQVKSAIADLLPYYCAPSMIIKLDELPMTSRGKVDKKALTVLAVKEQEKKND